MSGAETVVTTWPDADAVAEAAAARLASRLAAAQQSRGHAAVVLTGGSIGIATLAALARSPARHAVDWSRVEVWWGDERFVAVDDPDRNERQAREALLDQVALEEARVHPMPALGSPQAGADGTDVHAAAAAYADELARHASDRTSRADRPMHPGQPMPPLDVLLLGIGEDGHVASLFPHSPTLSATAPVVGVEDSPKPPSRRVSLTLPAIATADEVWLVVAGPGKAPAVRDALTGAGGVLAVPAAGAHGRLATLWLLDEAAAAGLPADLARPRTP